MTSIVTYFVLFIFLPVFVYLLYTKYKEHKVFREKINKIPGPPAVFLFGNAHQFKLDRAAFTLQIRELIHQYGKNKGIMRLWFGNAVAVILCKTETAEVILSSTKFIEKPIILYNFLKSWIGDGLLLSSGKKWHSRRKMLTPAFHFSILNGYIEIFNRQADILVKRLQTKTDNGLPFNVFSLVGLCALDIICETAMGVQLNAQLNANSEYVQAVTKISEIITKHERMPWLRIKPIFQLLHGKEYNRCLQTARRFVTKVIDDRIQERSFRDDNNKQTERKQRSSFLDLLLDMQSEHKLTYEDVMEEVDTFMLEGHDNTAASMGWAIFLLGHHPDAQEKVVEELKTIFENDNRFPTVEDIKCMKYLECVIKESLRLYPPVVAYGRTATETLEINGYEIPEGAAVFISPVHIHYDADTFGADYREFRPERFEDDSITSHKPYAYVPFSAGPRNCIGQRFALMEAKVVLSSIFRRYKVKSVDSIETNIGIPDLVLRPLKGVNILLTSRQ